MKRRDKILLALAIAILILFVAELIFRPFAFFTSMGKEFYKAGKYENAEKLFAKKAKNHDGTALSNRAKARYKQGDFDESAELSEEALRCEPDNANFYYDRGNSAFEAGDMDKAIKYYEEAILRNPDDDDARENLELALSKLEISPQEQGQQEQDEDEEDKQDQDEQELRNILEALDNMESRDRRKSRPQAPPKDDNWW